MKNNYKVYSTKTVSNGDYMAVKFDEFRADGTFCGTGTEDFSAERFNANTRTYKVHSGERVDFITVSMNCNASRIARILMGSLNVKLRKI